MNKVHKYILLLLCTGITKTFSQSKTDSIYYFIKTAKEDSNKVNALISLSRQLGQRGSFDSAISFAQRAGTLSGKINFKKGTANAYNLIGVVYYNLGNYPEALKNHYTSLKIKEEIGDKKAIAGSYNNIGNVYLSQGNSGEALKNYFASLKIKEEMGDKQGVSASYNNIGSVYNNMNKLPEALKNYFASLKIKKEIGDKRGFATCYINIGVVYFSLGNYSEALKNHFAALKIKEEIGDKEGIATCYINIGDVYTKQKQFYDAELYELKALSIFKETGDKDGIKDSYIALSEINLAQGNYLSACKNYSLYINYRDSLLNESNNKNIAEMQTRFETDKKQKEIELLQKDKNIRELQLSEQAANIKKQRTIIYSVIGGLLLVMVLILFIVKSYREKKKINTGLEEKNIEINLQKKLIEEKNILITDSIDYAKNIQNAILPDNEILRKYIPESFVLFLPKDIVSGDFYWLSPFEGGVRNGQTEDVSSEGILLAAVDCTGHGVPGAFMSVMAFNMLENIVTEKKLKQPSLILDELNSVVIETLHQDKENTSAKYGMDISLISLTKNKLQFAGAHNSLCLVRDNKLTELKADKTTIGMAKEKFINHSIEIEKGDMIYIFTDGYADQKGGNENKKFFAQPFRELLKETSLIHTNEQKTLLEKKHFEWKGKYEQIDDILIIGVRI